MSNPQRRRWMVAGVLVLVAIIAILSGHTPPNPVATTQPVPPATTRAATQPGSYFIGGNVQRPGAYSMEKSTTLRQLVVAAGLENGQQSEGAVVVRRDGHETGEMIRAELGPLMREKVGDVPLVPGDSVFVR